jgi:tetratricopeptide (TPR) repeat protein
MRVAEGTIKAPAEQAPERARQGWVPPELSAVALKALALKPADRYQTVEALQRDIQLYLEGRSVSAKHDSAWELFKKLVKRNQGASMATATALVVLIGVVSGAFYINNQARHRAEEARVEADKARARAEDNYQAFLKEQQEKHARTKLAAPAFLRAAQLMTREKQFDDALAQVNVALDYDPEQSAGWLFKGQVLLCLERFAQAEAPLREFLKSAPNDALARQLADLAARPAPDSAAYFWALADVLEKQKAKPFAFQMAHLAERFVGPDEKKRLDLYRKKIENVEGWAGLGKRLTLDKNGALHLHFRLLGNQVHDLRPLKGMKLSSLNLCGTQVEDLTPLEGMPLTHLDVRGCAGITNLAPLKGMQLRKLDLAFLKEVSSLEPLRRMPLVSLDLHGCVKVSDLGPLRETQLEDLNLEQSRVSSLAPLEGLKLRNLSLANGLGFIKDLKPLRDMPLEWLNLNHYNHPIRDFEPLRKMPLKYLALSWSTIRDLDVLQNMPLTALYLGACGNVEDLVPLKNMKLTKLTIGSPKVRNLEPLRDMPLKELNLGGCQNVDNFDVLKGLIHLTSLDLTNCGQLKDLNVLRDLKLEHLNILGCSKVHDLRPLKGMPLKTIALDPQNIQQGMEILRGMKTLDRIGVQGREFPAPEFWKLPKGEFK